MHRIDPTLRALIDRAAPLTVFAWRYRYPADVEEPTREEAEEALAVAHEAFEWVLDRLPPEVRP